MSRIGGPSPIEIIGAVLDEYPKLDPPVMLLLGYLIGRNAEKRPGLLQDPAALEREVRHYMESTGRHKKRRRGSAA